MNNIFDEVRAAVRAAELAQRAADQAALDMAKLLVGRLRSVSSNNLYSETRILVALKRELRDFNSVTRQWKKLGGGEK